MKWRWTISERMRTTLLVVASVALAGCGDTASQDNWTTVRDTLPSGTVRVTNVPAADRSPTWALVEELRVGSVDGAGPDVFGYLKGLVVLEGGGFAVLDSQVQELRVFGPDGAHIATHGRKGQGPGEFVDLTMTQIDSLPLPADRPEDEAYDPESQPGVFYQETGGGYLMYGIPFFPAEVSYIDSRGKAWSTQAGDPQYRIRRWQPSGGTELLLETRRPPVPVPAAERDSVIDLMRQMLSNMGVDRQWDWSRIPNVKPAVEAIFESAEGNLWVRTPSGGDGVLFDVYSGDGAYLGTASLGPGLNLFDRVAPVVRGDMAWLIVTDELDVNYVVRGRITPANRGPS